MDLLTVFVIVEGILGDRKTMGAFGKHQIGKPVEPLPGSFLFRLRFSADHIFFFFRLKLQFQVAFGGMVVNAITPDFDKPPW